jgi:hypothetical protein
LVIVVNILFNKHIPTQTTMERIEVSPSSLVIGPRLINEIVEGGQEKGLMAGQVI